jgi:hypothetical protein
MVMDKEKTKEIAHEISVKMMQVFYDNAEKFTGGDDPSEQIYLSGTVLGILNATMYLAMDGYARIYDLSKFNGDIFKGWVNEIEKELIEINREKMESMNDSVMSEIN